LLLHRYPKSWNENKITGLEWMKVFMKQHPAASHRKVESSILAGATSNIYIYMFIEFYGNTEWHLYI
jgi:hypothetical protein